LLQPRNRYQQIGSEEVTRRQLYQALWWAPDQGDFDVNNHSVAAYVLRPVADRKPAAQPHLVTAFAPQPNQPPLDLTDHQPDHAEATAPDDRGVRISLVKARWAARQRTGLPDAQEWSATFALAVIQTLLGQRSVAQATRWKYALVISGLNRDLNLQRWPSASDRLVWASVGVPGEGRGLRVSGQVRGGLGVQERQARNVAERLGGRRIGRVLVVFKFVNTPSHKPQVFQAPTLSEPDAATLAHWQPVARGLRILAFALRSYESIDDPWGTSPCQAGAWRSLSSASSFLTAITDAGAIDAYHHAIRAADAWLVQGNCVQSVAPLSDVEPS
jgi:hypothetical protein